MVTTKSKVVKTNSIAIEDLPSLIANAEKKKLELQRELTAVLDVKAAIERDVEKLIAFNTELKNDSQRNAARKASQEGEDYRECSLQIRELEFKILEVEIDINELKNTLKVRLAWLNG